MREPMRAYTAMAPGLEITAGEFSVATALPMTLDGFSPKYIIVQAMTNGATFLLGDSNVSIDNEEGIHLRNGGTRLLVFACAGCTHIATIRRASTDSDIRVHALEDY